MGTGQEKTALAKNVLSPKRFQSPLFFWHLEKQMPDGKWQPIDPSTGKPGRPEQTHIPLPGPDIA
jgi:hypothetical protein